ncbi:MAG: PucR family transcriptional regulator ligand-binding domain-containing protein [Hydrogenibacillus schlegelii]|uniref:PucR family transcriptional regulator ligand-binding domain-containing protein n=1 Tax=Hydrogenibacillus schlegelii TaxID=1484 RepID=A0A947CWX8_HYDSH|nr:PucR family transcriptional regulator ligand-binding domain-containing protein [Hydrogenibacillus schlegelii]
MGLTVQEAMSIGGLAAGTVVAGHRGLDRMIEHVTVMEVPDIVRWLKGGELILTSLYAIKDDEGAQRAIIRELDKVGSSAIAIKTQRYVECIPEVMRIEADARSFPIIEIPPQITYLDIMTPLIKEILSRTDIRSDKTENFFQWITELALSGKEITSILKTVEEWSHDRLTLETELPYLPAYVFDGVAPLSPQEKQILSEKRRPTMFERRIGEQSIPCVVAPIFLHEIYLGNVTLWKREGNVSQRDFMILERIIPLISLELLKAKTRHEVESEFKEGVLSQIIDGRVGREEDVAHQGRKFGWNFSVGYLLIVVELEHPDLMRLGYTTDTVTAKLALFLKTYPALMSIVFRRSERVIVFCHFDRLKPGDAEAIKAEALRLAVRMARWLRSLLSQEAARSQGNDRFSFFVGIGRYYDRLRDVHRSYKEALKAIAASRAMGRVNGVLHYDDLGVYRLLFQAENRDELRALYQETIGKLMENETAGEELVRTLERWFQHNGRLRDAARALYIHPNTLKYRLGRIEKLTGLRLDNSEDRLMLQLGLKIHSLFPFLSK